MITRGHRGIRALTGMEVFLRARKVLIPVYQVCAHKDSYLFLTLTSAYHSPTCQGAQTFALNVCQNIVLEYSDAMLGEKHAMGDFADFCEGFSDASSDDPIVTFKVSSLCSTI